MASAQDVQFETPRTGPLEAVTVVSLDQIYKRCIDFHKGDHTCPCNQSAAWNRDTGTVSILVVLSLIATSNLYLRNAPVLITGWLYRGHCSDAAPFSRLLAGDLVQPLPCASHEANIQSRPLDQPVVW